ncbi:acyltransferase [Herbaspirillum sp. 3R-3a1]|nr:acyltransferase [Herbaspirillum sp. 3R-3a1]
MIERKRYDHFQVARGIACLMVFANHVSGLLSEGLNSETTSSGFAPFLVPMGFPWVWLFLVLSGFLLTKGFVIGRFSLDSAGIKHFIIARLHRLLPLLWCVSALWFALYITGIWSPHLPAFDWKREIGVALAFPWLPYFQSTNAISSMNSPVWSAIIEIHYSLLLPLLFVWIGLSAKKMRWILVAWAFGIGALACTIFLFKSWDIFPLVYGNHLYNLGFFIAGGILSLRSPGIYIKRLPWSIVIIFTVASLLFVQYEAFFYLNATLALSPLLMLPVWCIVVARCDDQYQASVPTKFSGLWRGMNLLSILETLGMMSYSLYLAHKPISYILIEKLHLTRWTSTIPELVVMTFLCLLLSLPLFGVLFIFIERRFRMHSAPQLTNSRMI